MVYPVRYWDSDCFLGWLAEEPDKVSDCQSVIRAAEAGDLRIVTSSLTLVEVVKLKSRTPLPPEKEVVIRSFFEHSYIVIRQLDRRTAERARELIWKYGFNPKDSVHVATALVENVPRMDTFDGDLMKKSGMIGSPPLIIGRPDLPEQYQFDLPTEPEDQE